MIHHTTDPSDENLLLDLEINWYRLTWAQKKITRFNVWLTIAIIQHITDMELLRWRIDHKINRFVLYYIFPAHWLKR